MPHPPAWRGPLLLTLLLLLGLASMPTCCRAHGGIDASLDCLCARAAAARQLAINNSTGNMTERTNVAMGVLDHMLTVCTNKTVAPVRPLRVLIPTEASQIAPFVVSLFEAQTGLKVQTVARSFYDLTTEITGTVYQKLYDLYDGWIFHSMGMLDIHAAGALTDLSKFVQQDQNMLWSDIIPFVRNAAGVFNKTLVGLPIDYEASYMYYRKDLFEKYSLNVPNTWEEVALLAEKMDGKDYDGDGTLERSICLDPVGPHYLVMQILSSYTQVGGFRSGYLVDPATMRPLVNNPAMAKALSLASRLLAVSEDFVYFTGNPSNNQSSGFSTSKFNQGKCIMAFHFAEIFKQTAISYRVKGKLGTMVPPGSEEVLDRDTMQLVPCTRQLCSDAVSTWDNASSAVRLRYINRAPNSGRSGLAMGINPYAPPEWQAAMYRLISIMAGTAGQQFLVENFRSPIGPVRLSQLQSTEKWISLGYNLNDTVEFLRTTSRIMEHPNVVVDLRILHATELRDVMRNAAFQIARDNCSAAINTAMLNMERAMTEILKSDPNGLQAVQRSYWEAIGYTPPSQPSASSPPAGGISAGVTAASSDSSPPSNQLLAAILTPVILTVLGLSVAAFAVFMFYRRHQHRTFLGLVTAPGPGPDTTLLVTDIEGSTALWESLPADVMDAAIQVHHEVIRACTQRWTGYESATEGDSFLLAFHSPGDAAQFAVAAQAALLAHPDWPEALLRTNLCRPTYASSAADGGAQPSLALGLLSRISDLSFAGGSSAQQVPAAVLAACVSNRTSNADAGGLSLPLEKMRHPRSGLSDRALTLRLANNSAGSDSSHRASSPGSPANEPASPSAAGAATAKFNCENVPSLKLLHGSSSRGLLKLLASPSGTLGSFNLMSAKVQAGGACTARTVKEYLLQSCNLQGSDTGTLLWRGLRVRMGMHTGIEDASEVQINRVSGRTQYTGAAMKAARAVQGTAQGGMVLCNETTFRKMPLDALRPGIIVTDAGEHLLEKGDTEASSVYQLLGSNMLLRAAVMGPIRSHKQLSHGFLQAPSNNGAVCFMNCVGTSTLMAWNADIAKRALNVYHDIAKAELLKRNGYMLECADGLCLTSFWSTSDAVRWALHTVQQCLAANWGSELLEHELCEEISIASLQGESSCTTAGANHTRRPHSGSNRRTRLGVAGAGADAAADTAVKRVVLFRGLRLKCGVDYGKLSSEVSAVSGRVTHRGRVMNRSARIASLAKAGSVWCSEDAWTMAAEDILEEASPPCTGGGKSPWISRRTIAASHSARAPYSRTTSGHQGMVIKAPSDNTTLRPQSANGSGAAFGRTNMFASLNFMASDHKSEDVAGSPPLVIPSCRPSGLPGLQVDPGTHTSSDLLLYSLEPKEPKEPRIIANSMGPHKLKGVQEEITLLELQLDTEGNAPGVVLNSSFSAGRPSAATLSSQ